MSKVAALEADAFKITSEQSIEQLIEGFAVTEQLMDENLTTEDRLVVAEVRGWLMDELERRDAGAMEAWLETPEATIADLRSCFGEVA